MTPHEAHGDSWLTACWPNMRGWTLDTFPADDDAGGRALSAIREWLDPPSYPAWHPRALIYGPPGTGKTGLAFGAARDWAAHDNVEFVNVRALLAHERARFARGERADRDDRPTSLERLLDLGNGNCDLVVLDDLGAERPTEYALETIALVVEHLHREEVPLVVTTNYAPAALAQRLGHADLVVGQRIVSRLLEDALQIKLDRPDLRTRTRRIA